MPYLEQAQLWLLPVIILYDDVKTTRSSCSARTLNEREIISRHAFGRIAVDQIIKEAVGIDNQTLGGTNGSNLLPTRQPSVLHVISEYGIVYQGELGDMEGRTDL